MNGNSLGEGSGGRKCGSYSGGDRNARVNADDGGDRSVILCRGVDADVNRRKINLCSDERQGQMSSDRELIRRR